MAGKKGDAAREAVKNTIINAFGDDFVAFVDKKIYVWASDGGEKVQLAISMTIPKTPIASAEGQEQSGEAPVVAATPTKLSPEDDAKVHELMQRLGI